METGASGSSLNEQEIELWQKFSVPYRFPVRFVRNAFSPANPALAEAIGAAAVFPVVDEGVATTHPDLAERIERYAMKYYKKFKLAADLCRAPGGEECKNGPGEVEKLHRFFLKYHLCRHSVVLAIGGGAFLDVVGYAAATAHRGLRLIRMPTTVLAQNDAGIGVKNGYNAFGRKNWIGTFSPPFAVINDFEFLRTLPSRYKRSGMAEAVKVAVTHDSNFFDFLVRERRKLAAFWPEGLEKMIVRCAEIHLKHVASSDPFERESARPLDFGHWIAHALEDHTNGAILHGEAVAIGIAFDCSYAEEFGLISASERKAVINLIRHLGFELSHPALAELNLEEALDHFRQHLGGRLAITFPVGIGRSIEVNAINTRILQRTRDRLISSEEVANERKRHQAVGTRSAVSRISRAPRAPARSLCVPGPD